MALGSKTGKVIMHVETVNEGMSSSVLEPKKHLDIRPDIKFNAKEEVEMTTLDNLMAKKALPVHHYNFLLIDVQGYELEVLKGAEKTISGVDYIITEINGKEIYKECALVEELDDYLDQFGFRRMVNIWDNKSEKNWGDALYIKNLTFWQQHISVNIYRMLSRRYHLKIGKFKKRCKSFYKSILNR